MFGEERVCMIFEKKFSFVLLISIVYNTLMIFYTLMPSAAIVFSILFVFSSIYLFRRQYSTFESLLLVCILMIPTSFVSVLGTSFSQLPLTWHNLLVIIMMATVVLGRKINRGYFFIFVLFLSYGLFTMFNLPFPIDAMKQLLTIELFICSFIIAGYECSNGHSSIVNIGWECYFVGTISVALQILLQRMVQMSIGLTLGHYGTAGVSRVLYAGLMGDYSFATLYLASGCVYALIMHLSYKKMGLFAFGMSEFLLIISMLFVSSRTGLLALAVVVVLFFVFNLRKLNPKYLVILVIMLVAFPQVAMTLMEKRGGGQALLDSSGRIENYVQALQMFTNKAFWGYGLGLDNLYSLTGLKVPHNYFVQYLVQLGLIGTGIITSAFLLFTKYLKKSGYYKWIFILIVIGSMVIPDIVSSRFLSGIVILIMLTANQDSKDFSMGEYRQ